MRSFIPSLVAVLLACVAHAAEQRVTAPDPDLPQPFEFDPKVLTDMLTHSPFNRFVSLEDSFQLTGVAYIDGKPMATLMNKETKQRFVVSEEPNAMGWSLTEASVSDEPSKTQVRVMIGDEEVVMHYSEMQLTPGAAKTASKTEPTPSKKHSSSHSSSSNSATGADVDVASMLGDKGKELFNSLPPDAREKLTAIVKASAAKHPDRSPQENAALAQKLYAKMVSSSSKSSSSSTKNTTSSKPSKKVR